MTLLMDRLTAHCLLVAFWIVHDSIALKDVSVVVPQAALIGDSVALHCNYNLEGEPLYTVKWYKGSREFYRYLPKELPNTQVFPLDGINVDLSNSSPNKVVLRNVQPVVTGRYRCEVSTDAPNFYTNIETGYLYVVKSPEGDPQIAIEKDSYEIGYVLTGNCTSPSSYPSINLTWIINDKRVNSSSVMYVRAGNASDSQRGGGNKEAKVTVARFEHEIDTNTFQDGKVRVRCVASLFNIYRSQAEVVLEEDRPRPRPSSVLGTKDASSGLFSQLVGLYVTSGLLFGLVLR